MLVKIRLGDEAASRLIQEATRNLRPVNWQAEIILLDALGVKREKSEKSEAVTGVTREQI